MEDTKEIEKVLFDFVYYVKRFNQYLTDKYQLKDNPFNVKGRAFPKSALEIIETIPVEYKFHGGGCTIKWEGLEIMYNIDVSSINDIVVSSYEIVKFISTNPQFSTHLNYSYDSMHHILEILEKKRVLMTRKPSDLGAFHINLSWYEIYKDGGVFDGANKDNIDWL